MKKPIYFDYAATAPVDPRVAECLTGFLTLGGVFGNPASRSHGYGWQAEAAVEAARKQVADLVNCDPREIVWTSGATESDNLAIKGLAMARQAEGRHIITSQIEHKAVLDTCGWLELQGFEVTYLVPGGDGVIQLEQVLAAVRPDTILVSLMHVNNETGVITDIAAIGAALRERGIAFHVDAAQSAGKIPVDLDAIAVDLMSFSGHKVYGPKGIGALYVRRSPSLRIEAQMHGGGHERGMRSGTLPTHQIAGMGKAFEIASEALSDEMARLTALRQRLVEGFLAIGGVTLNGHAEQRVPGIANFAFADVDGESLMLGLRDLAVSSGSACSSASLEPSYVLRAMGLSDELAHASLRFSVGRFTTDEEIEFAIAQVSEMVPRLREASHRRRARAQ
ncbi:IscS subfamily cysteine desulfurase [Mangrovitalea sediminis]|uniref:IscS subfamily cysteine desulfurase n=1 Tax=Mangrovitalea sediminis TaxID=1982043 RepID=UPI000BE5D109|nr:IscS subfamily cysteine desulfurase [Mangrovitalea sediminis]